MSEQVISPVTEQQVVQGGPGVDTPEKEVPLAPSTRKVKLSGSEFEVDAGLAAALEAREAEFTHKLSENSEEVGRARDIISKYVPIVPTEQPKDEDEELALLLFEKPAEAIRKIRQQTIKEVQSQYAVDQGQKEYWQVFVGNYPELKNALWVAQQVLANNFESWKGLKVPESMKKLAQATKEQIVALTGEVSDDGNPPKVRRTRVETPGSPQPRQDDESAPTQATPLTTLISRRREARRKAMMHQK